MTTSPQTPAPPKSKKKAWLILAATALIVVLGLAWYTIHSRLYPSTNDTYVQAHVVNIAPQVSGPVVNVFVQDHQVVKQGQPLFTIDPEQYQSAYNKADAALKLAQEQGARIFPLVRGGKIAPSEGDKITAQIEEAAAAFNQTKYDLEHTTVVAPANGIVADFTVRVGNTVNAGINLFAIVEQQDFWVDANFKETQLERIKVGQSAKIKVDMYPNTDFRGVVTSVSPGSGALFSLLPPENATGNWVKVTQRVPVKISIVKPDPKFPLIAGTSATVTVDTTQ